MSVQTGTCIPREPGVDLVRIISEGTYTSFAQAIKEFISNAYDADATRVDVTIDDDCNLITIRDNGVGLTYEEFRDCFASIARTGKAGARSPRGRTRLGRPKIGRFGIGSLAVIGSADRFTVRSVRRASKEGFEATIDLRALRRHFEKGEDLSQRWRFSYRQWPGEAAKTHFTEIQLSGINQDVRSLFLRLGERTPDDFFKSTRQLSGIDELAWQLGIICPVPYKATYPVPEDYLDRRRDRLIFDEAKALLRADFSIFLNGREVRRMIGLPRFDPSALKRSQEAKLLTERGMGFELRNIRSPKDAPVRYRGYLFTQGRQLFPEELRGVLVRLRGVAIGWHATLGVLSGVLQTMRPCISGEVWVEGLEDALQFDRESFRQDHPKVIWLRERITSALKEEEKHFRQRSEQRKAKQKGEPPPKPKEPPSRKETAPASRAPPSDSFIAADVFDGQPDYVVRLIPQINGCWDRLYYEACSVLLRRLIETLIVQLYHQRGWLDELKDPATQDFVTLKNMVNKVCGDQRIGLDGKAHKTLKKLKELGDIAAHDFRVRIRKSDLERVRSDVRFTCERLMFKTGQDAP